MAENPMVTIALTKEQQLEVLAATGLRVTSLEIDPASLDGEGALSANLPLPHWLQVEALEARIAPGMTFN